MSVYLFVYVCVCVCMDKRLIPEYHPQTILLAASNIYKAYIRITHRYARASTHMDSHTHTHTYTHTHAQFVRMKHLS